MHEPTSERSGSGPISYPSERLGRDPLGKSVFLHKDVPDGWWDEYVALAPTHFTPRLFLARSSLAWFTWTETMRMLEPIGINRWADELGLKYGMRDELHVSGRRAMVGCVLVEEGPVQRADACLAHPTASGQ